MGAGIAALCLLHETSSVAIVDPLQAQAQENIRSQLERFLKKQDQVQRIDILLAKLLVSDAYTALYDADIVIEAVPEDIKLKEDVLRNISTAVSLDTIIGSNTSSFPISQLSNYVTYPERFLGVHFMNPVLLMDLVELISTQQTSQSVFQSIESWLKELEKITVVADDQPGFTVNRVLIPMINTAFELLASEKVSPKDIDLAMVYGAGFPMGPLQLADMIGLDTCLSIMETLSKAFGETHYKPSERLKLYVQEGNIGKKSGKGVYSY